MRTGDGTLIAITHSNHWSHRALEVIVSKIICTLVLLAHSGAFAAFGGGNINAKKFLLNSRVKGINADDSIISVLIKGREETLPICATRKSNKMLSSTILNAIVAQNTVALGIVGTTINSGCIYDAQIVY